MEDDIEDDGPDPPDAGDDGDGGDNASSGDQFDDWSAFSRGENLSSRANGDTMESDLLARSTAGGSALVCSSSGPSDQGSDYLTGLFGTGQTAEAEKLYSSPPSPSVLVLGNDGATYSTERATNWTGADFGEAHGGFAQSIATVRDFVAGVGDFVGNYEAMRDANVRGADRYFHCMANCEATERGPGGEAAALLIGFGREAVDLPKNMAFKGLSFKDSIADGLGDLEANRVGREGALSGVRCNDVCQPLKPRGL